MKTNRRAIWSAFLKALEPALLAELPGCRVRRMKQKPVLYFAVGETINTVHLHSYYSPNLTRIACNRAVFRPSCQTQKALGLSEDNRSAGYWTGTGKLAIERLTFELTCLDEQVPLFPAWVAKWIRAKLVQNPDLVAPPVALAPGGRESPSWLASRYEWSDLAGEQYDAQRAQKPTHRLRR